MGYFAVMLTRAQDGWDTNDIELDEVDSLAELAEVMRECVDEIDAEWPVLLLLEQEDLWFALVRVDGDEDPRVFVSDRHAVEHSAYAEMLLEGTAGHPEEDLGEDENGADNEPQEAEIDDGPVGDLEILADHGTDAKALLALCESDGVLPSEALTALAERAGAVGALESVR